MTHRDRDTDPAAIKAQLDRIERKIDLILAHVTGRGRGRPAAVRPRLRLVEDDDPKGA